ncbi:thiamine-phosphate kinase [Shewanella yunxiaonensis]|uniref:Thiamine-monophosphate kinase n=1 Tax=Shewanella yunxiaonensis TaxID=2829809 RepID=A0ABX7YWU7_9GAMM|nr:MULTISPECIES: thiamine-phosphate kinase [Shewanella]MDF0532872.1 thiamine-phosphate kinase [Shewanella sp. A32]QUN06754.1 thiamine-phosphate kinase [Shewanella yunxiaonensis]
MKEFQLIEHYFTGQSQHRKDVKLGIGDDCALVKPTENKLLAISTDTLVENVHFLPQMPPQALGYKALAVNLSDLAAMGAEPAWMTLALTMPTADDVWLQAFATGLFEAADYYMISLVGGDTTRGPKSITITVHGQVPEGKAITRSGAKPGDWIYVTGSLGDSALGLDILLGKREVSSEHRDYLINRHYHPSPRVLAGQSLRGLASSAIDLSDGLNSDIKHILKASGVGAVIDVEKLPLSPAMRDSVALETAINYALSGGEDYELLFTVPEAQRGALDTALSHAGVRFSQIGQIQALNKLKLQFRGEEFVPAPIGFEHFQ